MDVIGLGRFVVDMFAGEWDRPIREVDSFLKYPGGAPANVVVALARLGVRTGLISRVGNDEFGIYLVDFLRKEGIDTTHVGFDSERRTSLSFCGTARFGDFPFFQYGEPGSNLRLRPADISEGYIKKARILFTSGTIFSASPSREAGLTALSCARKNQVITAFDINYREGFWESRDVARVHYKLILGLSDVVFGTNAELGYVGGNEDVDRAAAGILELGAKMVCVKFGERGSRIFTQSETIDIPAFQVEPFDCSGAGDSYNAGFLYGPLKGWNLRRCGEFASAVSAIVVTRRGASVATPTLAEVEAFLNSYRR